MSQSRCSRADVSEFRHSSRSEEHTSELQSPCNLVCRLLLEKKKKLDDSEALPDCLDADCTLALANCSAATPRSSHSPRCLLLLCPVPERARSWTDALRSSLH